MKQLIFVILLFTQGFAALAAGNGPDDLWAREAKESTWQLVPLAVPGLTGAISAYLTDTGAVKLESVGDSIQSEAQVISSQFSRYTDMAQFQKTCVKTEVAYPSYRHLNLPYEVRMKILAPRNHGLAYQLQGSTGNSAVAQLATDFLPLDTFQLHINAGSDALLFKSSDLDLKKLEARLLAQIVAQKADIADSGEIRLDFSGYEDVICDLLGGRAKLQVQTYLNYSRAKLEHQTRLNAADLGQILDYAHGRFQTQATLTASVLAAGRVLGVAVDKRGLNPELSDAEFARLNGLLFNGVTGDLRAFGGDDVVKAAAKMDILKDAYTYSYPVYEAVPHSPFDDPKPSSGGWFK